MERRTFLKAIGTVGFTLISASLTPSKPFSEQEPVYGMIIDLDKCIGCEACTVACAVNKKYPLDGFNTKVNFLEVGKYPAARQYFVPVQCNHCEDPPCMATCDTGAITKLPNGIIFTDWQLCNGSGDCVDACPFGMRYMTSIRGQGRKSAKCDFCFERLQQGKEPICVATCPSRARVFGNLARPKGEFARYLNERHLFQLSGQEGHLFYMGDSKIAHKALKQNGKKG